MAKNRSYIEQKFNAAFDSGTLAFKTVDHGHFTIHSGVSYSFSVVDTVAGSGTYVVRFVTPDTDEFIHFIAGAGSDENFEFRLYEGTTFTGDGSAGTAYNRNRSFSDTQVATVSYDATINSAGTEIYGVGADTGGRFNNRADHEWKLARDTAYAIEITNLASTQASVSVTINYYKHEDKGW